MSADSEDKVGKLVEQEVQLQRLLRHDLPRAIPLAVHEDLRGYLFEMYRVDMGLPFDVKQVYCSAIRPGVVKGWHLHRQQWDMVTCVHGEIQLAVWKHEKEEGMTWVLSPRSLYAVVIPPGWYHGWRNIGQETALVVNCVSSLYNREQPDEERKDPHGINADVWETRDG